MAVAICANPNCRRPLPNFNTRLCVSCAVVDPSGKYHRSLQAVGSNQTGMEKRKRSKADRQQSRERAGWSWKG